jgi:hypothetical protein
MIFKNIFAEKSGENISVFCPNYCYFLVKKIDHNIGFWEKRHFFDENWQESQKIIIITSSPFSKKGYANSWFVNFHDADVIVGFGSAIDELSIAPKMLKWTKFYSMALQSQTYPYLGPML